MKNELITDLLPRLEHGVILGFEAKSKGGIVENKAVAKLTGIDLRHPSGNEMMNFDYLDVVNNIRFGTTEVGKLKPFLFNSLTDPITIAGYNDGKPFVPVEELAKIERTKNPRVMFPESDKQDNFVYEIQIMVYEADPDLIPIWMANLLNQWHCNYRLSDDQFIPATNEYS